MARERIRRFNLASKIQRLYVLAAMGDNYSLVLDLGAGDGEFTLHLAGQSNKLYSVDSDPIRVNRIYQVLRQHELTNVVVSCCSAERLPYCDSYFDLIICNSVLEHIEEYSKVIDEVYRVLKRDGLLLITVPNANMQFGSVVKWFWKAVFALPIGVRSALCCDKRLADCRSIQSVRKYLNEFFNHKAFFSANILDKIMGNRFKLINRRYYMNYWGAFLHDVAYYFKAFDNRILLDICYLVGVLEFKLGRGIRGKGFLGSYVCHK